MACVDIDQRASQQAEYFPVIAQGNALDDQKHDGGCMEILPPPYRDDGRLSACSSHAYGSRGIGQRRATDEWGSNRRNDLRPVPQHRQQGRRRGPSWRRDPADLRHDRPRSKNDA